MIERQTNGSYLVEFKDDLGALPAIKSTIIAIVPDSPRLSKSIGPYTKYPTGPDSIEWPLGWAKILRALDEIIAETPDLAPSLSAIPDLRPPGG